MTPKPELSDFLVDVVRHSFFPSERVNTKEYDLQKIMALPEEDFARVHYLLMRQYKDGDGWWKNNDVKCSSCKENIPGPAELVRHSSNAYHLKCFKEMYNKTKAEFIKRLARDPKVHTAKWERISNLDQEKLYQIEKEVNEERLKLPPTPGIYEHFKGNLYEVIGIIINSDTLEEKVEYVALYNHEKYGENSRWYRSIEEFNSPKIIDGKEVPRFKFVEKN